MLVDVMRKLKLSEELKDFPGCLFSMNHSLMLLLFVFCFVINYVMKIIDWLYQAV